MRMVHRPASLAEACSGAFAVVNCAPYRSNEAVMEAALVARAHYVDLGGNTDIVKKEILLHPLAVKAGVSVPPGQVTHQAFSFALSFARFLPTAGQGLGLKVGIRLAAKARSTNPRHT